MMTNDRPNQSCDQRGFCHATAFLLAPANFFWLKSPKTGLLATLQQHIGLKVGEFLPVMQSPPLCERVTTPTANWCRRERKEIERLSPHAPESTVLRAARFPA